MNYAKRRNIFDSGECAWRVEDDALAINRPDGTTARIPWRDVSKVQVSYAPTRMKGWRYVFVLTYPGGKETIDNVHFAGLGSFENRSTSFAPFVKDCLARLKAANPTVRAHAGSNTLTYVAQLGFVLVTFAFLAFVLFLVPLGIWPGMALVKLALIALMLPVFFRWIKRARPRDVALDDIPEDALPRVT